MQKAWGHSNVNISGSIAVGGLGVGDTIEHDSPTDIIGGVAFVAAHSIGNSGTLFISTTGTVYYAGTNRSGAYGDGTAANSGINRSTPTQVPGLSNVVKVACGNACYALDNTGVLWGWASNTQGQLNLGSSGGTGQLTPISVTTSVVDFDSNGFTLWVLKSGGQVWACGQNFSGETGFQGTTNIVFLTNTTPATGTVVQVIAGNSTGYLRMADGTVMASTTAPVTPDWGTTPFTGAVDVFTGNSNVFIRMADDSIWGIGANNLGQLGTGSTGSTVTTPTQWLAPTGFTLQSTGQSSAFRQTFAVLGTDGLVYTWGWGAHGEMGNGGTTANNPTPASTNGLTGVEWIAQGGTFQFASDNLLSAPPASDDAWAAVIG